MNTPARTKEQLTLGAETRHSALLLGGALGSMGTFAVLLASARHGDALAGRLT
jgi:hypothetical protein